MPLNLSFLIFLSFPLGILRNSAPNCIAWTRDGGRKGLLRCQNKPRNTKSTIFSSSREQVLALDGAIWGSPTYTHSLWLRSGLLNFKSTSNWLFKMLQSRGWLKLGTLVVFSSATVCCAVLGIQLLTQDKTAKAGIATLIVQTLPPFPYCLANVLSITVQLYRYPSAEPLIKPRAIPGSDLIQPL